MLVEKVILLALENFACKPFEVKYFVGRYLKDKIPIF